MLRTFLRFLRDLLVLTALLAGSFSLPYSSMMLAAGGGWEWVCVAAIAFWPARYGLGATGSRIGPRPCGRTRPSDRFAAPAAPTGRRPAGQKEETMKKTILACVSAILGVFALISDAKAGQCRPVDGDPNLVQCIGECPNSTSCEWTCRGFGDGWFQCIDFTNGTEWSTDCPSCAPPADQCDPQVAAALIFAEPSDDITDEQGRAMCDMLGSPRKCTESGGSETCCTADRCCKNTPGENAYRCWKIHDLKAEPCHGGGAPGQCNPIPPA